MSHLHRTSSTVKFLNEQALLSLGGSRALPCPGLQCHHHTRFGSEERVVGVVSRAHSREGECAS